MKIGYTTTNDATLINALKKAGCEKIFIDAVKSNKKELNKAVNCLKSNDQLIVCKLDNLANSIHDLIKISQRLKRNEVELHSLNDNIDTSSNNCYFDIIEVLARLKKNERKNNIKNGIETAKQNGKTIGRPKVSKEKISEAKKMLKDGMSYTEVAKSLRISLSSLYKYVPAL